MSFYKISAYNTQALYVWASDAGDVACYVDWLNRNRDINMYSADPIPESQWADMERRDDVLSMDEPGGWDDLARMIRFPTLGLT